MNNKKKKHFRRVHISQFELRPNQSVLLIS